jgi:hypothetical protein
MGAIPQWVWFVLAVAVYVALTRWLLPKLGVQT